MRVVILQPSYIPWRGYFHQVALADTFVFLDNVQYDKHGWRNRNRVKTRNGVRWLTIPVLSKGVVSGRTLLSDVEVCWDTAWNKKHWATLQQSYSRAPYFSRYAPVFERAYAQRPSKLTEFTIEMTILISEMLGLSSTRFQRASELGIEGSKTDRLIDILKKLQATTYLSGPSAANYLDTERLAAAGLETEFMVYDYEPYEQLYPPYESQVSILDLLFMVGPDAPSLIWGRRGLNHGNR